MPKLLDAFRAQVAALQGPGPLVIGGKSMGERDSFGNRREVEAYPLSTAIDIQWITDGDHSFKPTRSSGLREADAWADAVQRADRYLARVSAMPGRAVSSTASSPSP